MASLSVHKSDFVIMLTAEKGLKLFFFSGKSEFLQEHMTGLSRQNKSSHHKLCEA